MRYCKKCNKEISAIEDNLYSGYCENCYDEVNKKNQKQYSNTHNNNIIATILKALSIFISIIGIIGLIVGIATDEMEVFTGIIIILSSFISSIFIYGFGEIIQLLEDIKNK